MNGELQASLTTQEWDLVANALGQLPYVKVVGVINKLGTQLQSPPAPPVPPPPPEEVQAAQGET